ncbi:Uncharacterised protein [Enterobacter hormaechei]|nr:Uncharacterised protein [Enterobacter hormaechei]
MTMPLHQSRRIEHNTPATNSITIVSDSQRQLQMMLYEVRF